MCPVFGEALAISECVFVGEVFVSEHVFGGSEVGVFQGVMVGDSVGDPANRTFDTLSPGMRCDVGAGVELGEIDGLMEGVSLG